MADKQVIAATLTVNAGSSNANIKEVNKNLNDVRGSLSATSAQATATGKSIEGSTGSFGKLKEQMTALPGPLGQAGEGVNKLGGAFKALLANPVALVLVAIVAALALLYKAFTNTFEGGQKMEQIFAGIKAAGQALIDNLEKIGSAITKVFHFDFSGAIKDIKGVAQAAGEAYSKMADLVKQAQSLHKEQLANDLDTAKRAKDLAELREKATDESVPIKERIKLLKELQVQAQQNAKDDLDLADRTAKNKIAQLTVEKDGERKNQDEINKIRIEQINGATDNANELRRINKQITAAEKQEEADRKALAKEQEAANKEAHDKAVERSKERARLIKEQTRLENEAFLFKVKRQQEELKQEQEFGAALAKEQEARDKAEAQRQLNNEKTRLDNKKKLAELNALDNPDDPKAKIELIRAQLDLENSLLADDDIQKQINAKAASDKIVAITQEEVDAKLAIRDIERQHTQETVSAIGDAFGTLSAIAGKQTAAGKAFAIAQTTIATFQAGFAAFKGMVTSIPGPVGIALGVVAAAGALASGIAAVKKIVAVPVPGGGGGGSAPSGGIALPAAPVAPVQASTSLDQASLNGIGNAATSNNRVYVLDQDVANNRERNERLNRAARLG